MHALVSSRDWRCVGLTASLRLWSQILTGFVRPQVAKMGLLGFLEMGPRVATRRWGAC